MRITSNVDVQLKKDVISCNFTWESGFVCEENYFIASEFIIYGKVVSYDDPISNVALHLHKGDSKISLQDKSLGSIQHSISDAQGFYKFTNIPSGNYQITAIYSDQSSKF